MVIIITGLVAGSLDLVMAMLLFVSRSKQKPSVLFRYIASAAFGAKVSTAGMGMAWLGLVFHYLIAMVWTVLYFFVFQRVLPCGSVAAHAVVYGMFVWVVMNLVVLPMSKAEPRPWSAPLALVNIVILIIAIGWPCAYGAQA